MSDCACPGNTGGGSSSDVANCVKNYSKLAIVCIAIFLLLGGIFGFCLYKVITIIQFYYNQRSSIRDTASGKTSSNTYGQIDDNEIYITPDNMVAENDDEYLRYTDHINKSVAEYKTYNEKLKKFYQTNKPGETTQDVIDKGILQR